MLGGILLFIGYWIGFVMFMFFCYWIFVIFIVYVFWLDLELECWLEFIMFMKNIVIVGGFFMVWANGVGKYSIKWLFVIIYVFGN